MAQIDELLRKNELYAREFNGGSLSSIPRRKVAIISCMDARLDLSKILGLENGDAHIIRNAGGIITEDVIRSLLISQRLLKTEEIMVIHHTDCGMLKFNENDLKDRIQQETGIRPQFELGAISNLEDDVRKSIFKIVSNPFIPRKDRVRGFIYDVKTGRIKEVI